MYVTYVALYGNRLCAFSSSTAHIVRYANRYDLIDCFVWKVNVKCYVLDGVIVIWLYLVMRYYTEYAKIIKICRSYLYVRLPAWFIYETTERTAFYIRSSVHRNSILTRSNKMQQYAGIYLLQNYSTCFGCPSHPSSGIHKTVTAASGTETCRVILQ